jgi:hypothetical protein
MHGDASSLFATYRQLDDFRAATRDLVDLALRYISWNIAIIKHVRNPAPLVYRFERLSIMRRR